MGKSKGARGRGGLHWGCSKGAAEHCRGRQWRWSGAGGILVQDSL